MNATFSIPTYLTLFIISVPACSEIQVLKNSGARWFFSRQVFRISVWTRSSARTVGHCSAAHRIMASKVPCKQNRKSLSRLASRDLRVENDHVHQDGWRQRYEVPPQRGVVSRRSDCPLRLCGAPLPGVAVTARQGLSLALICTMRLCARRKICLPVWSYRRPVWGRSRG